MRGRNRDDIIFLRIQCFSSDALKAFTSRFKYALQLLADAG